jgi:predicted dehydrogenase
VQIAGPSPNSVFADFQYRREWDVETGGGARLRDPGAAGSGWSGEGVRYVIVTGAISAIPKPRWLIRGSEGAYVQYGRDAQEAALNRGEVGPRVMDAEHAPRVVRWENGALRDVPVQQVPGNYLEYYANVAAAIRGAAPLAVDPAEVLQSIRLLLAAVRAAETGDVQHLGEHPREHPGDA